jgi:hypothetical protein
VQARLRLTREREDSYLPKVYPLSPRATAEAPCPFLFSSLAATQNSASNGCAMIRGLDSPSFYEFWYHQHQASPVCYLNNGLLRFSIIIAAQLFVCSRLILKPNQRFDRSILPLRSQHSAPSPPLISTQSTLPCRPTLASPLGHAAASLSSPPRALRPPHRPRHPPQLLVVLPPLQPPSPAHTAATATMAELAPPLIPRLSCRPSACADTVCPSSPFPLQSLASPPSLELHPREPLSVAGTPLWSPISAALPCLLVPFTGAAVARNTWLA